MVSFTSSCLLVAINHSLYSFAHSWGLTDQVTLHFWSPVSECTAINFKENAICDVTAVEAGYILDNTGATCYSNPTSQSPNWITWLGPDPGCGDNFNGGVNVYSITVPDGQPMPTCDSKGVCSCDAIDPIRGTNSSEWWSSSDSAGTTQRRFGYSGCGTSGITIVTEKCSPFQGNITVGPVPAPTPPSAATRTSVTLLPLLGATLLL
mmetsp:Transcript_20610/g.44772  ORF Transcript_20610/g.44772 Transcript_20610/m.44772 type:complete len:207 (+) Transcript_20610:40-660(+)